MNLKSITIEVLIIIVLGLLAVSTLNPYWMPMGMHLTALLALIVLFGVFAVYVWREKGADEREVMLINQSDRIAFLTGASVLIIAIIAEGIVSMQINPWILGAFATMVIAKAAAYIYNSTKH